MTEAFERIKDFLADDWLGVLLFLGDVGCALACFWLSFAGAWWLLPFGLLLVLMAMMVGRQLWQDWRG